MYVQMRQRRRNAMEANEYHDLHCRSVSCWESAKMNHLGGTVSTKDRSSRCKEQLRGPMQSLIVRRIG